MDERSALGGAPVSVVIPCYRAGDSIGRAVSSVLNQSLPVSEIILVDDASGDGTLSQLQRIAQWPKATSVRVLTAERNGGAGEARNLGWQHANQPWVAFLDADDAWHPRKIELQYAFVRAHPETVLCAHGTRVSQSPEWELPMFPEHRLPYYRVQRHVLPFLNVIPTRSVMVRTDLPWRFYPGKRYAEDFALWLKIVCSGAPVYKLKVPLACTFRPEFSGEGVSARLWAQERGELDALRRMRDEQLMSSTLWTASTLASLVKFGMRVLAPQVARYVGRS